MKEDLFSTFRYKPNDHLREDNCWSLEPQGFKTPWIKEYNNYPNKPLIVHVKAGQSLYIPACCNSCTLMIGFHAVEQIDDKLNDFEGTIAINWWYDMDYNSFSCMMDFVKNVGRLIQDANTKRENHDNDQRFL